jgi:hypothetical protein
MSHGCESHFNLWGLAAGSQAAIEWLGTVHEPAEASVQGLLAVEIQVQISQS